MLSSSIMVFTLGRAVCAGLQNVISMFYSKTLLIVWLLTQKTQNSSEMWAVHGVGLHHNESVLCWAAKWHVPRFTVKTLLRVWLLSRKTRNTCVI